MYNQKLINFDEIINEIYKSDDFIVHVNLIDKYVDGLNYLLDIMFKLKAISINLY